MTIAVDWLPSHDLHFAASEALVIRCTIQLAIQTRRGNLQHIASSWHHVLDIEDGSEFAAELSAVLVRHAARLIEEDPEHPALAPSAQFDLDHFQPTGGRHALGNGPHAVFFKCHEFNE